MLDPYGNAMSFNERMCEIIFHFDEHTSPTSSAFQLKSQVRPGRVKKNWSKRTFEGSRKKDEVSFNNIESEIQVGSLGNSGMSEESAPSDAESEGTMLCAVIARFGSLVLSVPFR